ncbi:permease prefix domain 1-containing protein [Demequina phytophila]|uniref:permease prefix domain 1-containing protein n=1 Tax=Demequina phytophila TaxID=1638981 RepID=UPI000785934D|nr:permease prefix domain 1-containing protein [Demequina phytophila]
MTAPEASGPAGAPAVGAEVEAEIGRWRQYILARGSVSAEDADELEDHLRGHVDGLMDAGLADDEALLVAVKRMGSQAEVAHEFARQHSRRLWRDLVLDGGTPRSRDGILGMLAFGAAAGLAAKVMWLLAANREHVQDAAPVGIPLVLGVLATFLWWRRRASSRVVLAIGGTAVGLAALGLAYPFDARADTAILFAIHAAIAMWLAVGVGYAGGHWRSRAARMDFIRFTGEWAIYMFLIATAGGALMGVSMAVFQGLGIDIADALFLWVLPLGLGGATVVAAWLVESKQEVLETIAPVLTRIFTPIATIAVLAMLAGALVSGGFEDSRESLIAVDLLLVVVLGLVLYSLTAQSPASPVGWADRMQLALVVAALLLDLAALVAMAGRVAEFGFTPNRLVTLGVNAVLVANLGVTAWLYIRRVARRGDLAPLLRWQTGYIPVYGVWALAVCVVVPPLFAFA